MPYDYGSTRSIYHIREYNVRRLSLVRHPPLCSSPQTIPTASQLSSPDIFLSHDWPCTIERHGNVAALLRRKPFFRADIENERLGSPPLMGLLKTLKPAWWFAAHLHVKFDAIVKHGGEGQQEGGRGVANPDEITIEFDEESELEQCAVQNPDEIVLDDDVESTETARPAPVLQQGRSETRFLALDKCLPRRDFLEVRLPSVLVRIND